MINDAIDEFLGAVLRGEEACWPRAWHGPATVAAARERVEFHGIAPLLVDMVGTLDDWPAELAAAVREEARLQAFWEESHRAVVARLLQNLEAAGVGALIMKGTALAYSVYDNPALRRRGDTDLLVRERDVERARACLKETGFTLFYPSVGYNFQESWMFDTGIGFVHELDLHWRVTTAPTLNAVFDMDECFARAMPLPRLQENARAVDPVLTFIHCCMNQALHGIYGCIIESGTVLDGDRLGWAWDNDLAIRSFSQDDWQELLRICRERGLGPLCLERLNHTRAVLRSSVPPAVIDELATMADDAGIFRYIGHTDQNRRFLDDVRASKGIGAKFAFIGSKLFPDRRTMRERYPDGDKVPMLLLHCRRIREILFRLIGRPAT